MREERETVVSALEKQRQEMAKQTEQTERLREEAVEARVRGEMAAEVQAKVGQERQLAALPALQSRLQSLHASKLLADEELYKLEDTIADSLEEEDAGSGGQVAKLIVFSERMAGDAALARQLRRKFT